MAEFGAEIQKQLPEANLSTTGEWNGKQWFFLAEYTKGNKPSDEVEEKVKQIAKQVDYNATVYVLEMGSSY